MEAEALAQLEPLNRLLERDATFGRIVPRPEGGDGPFQLQMVRIWRTPEALLLPIGAGAGPACVCGGFLQREGVRGPSLHAVFCRPHARSGSPLVQHGGVWEPSEAGGASPAREGASRLDQIFRLRATNAGMCLLGWDELSRPRGWQEW